jgi:hypothetical protein
MREPPGVTVPIREFIPQFLSRLFARRENVELSLRPRRHFFMDHESAN